MDDIQHTQTLVFCEHSLTLKKYPPTEYQQVFRFFVFKRAHNHILISFNWAVIQKIHTWFIFH